MRTIFIEHAEPAFAVAEDNDILAEETDSQWCAVALGHFLCQAGGNPVPAHDLPHGGVSFDTAEQVIFLGCHRAGLCGAITVCVVAAIILDI